MAAADIHLESGPREYEAQISQHIQGQKQKAELQNNLASQTVQRLLEPQRVNTVPATRSEMNKTLFNSGGASSGVGGKVDVTG